jgi:hypothetical protein
MSCAKHGEQLETVVCSHLAKSLEDGVAVGFYWARHPNDFYGEAWCSACNERLRAEGGEWTPQLAASLAPHAVCERCYDELRAMNGL